MRGAGKTYKNFTGYAFLSPWLLGFFAFVVLPIVASIYYSFTDYDILKAPVWNGIENFKAMMGDALFWQSLKVTFVYAFTAVPLRLAFALAVAMLFNRRARMLKLYQAIFYIPSVLGEASRWR